MTKFVNKSLYSQVDAATIHFKGISFRLSRGVHLIGRNVKKFVIDDESVDEKHALINISDSGHQIIDLESKNGIYLDNEKVDQNIFLTNKTSLLRFGNCSTKYTILNQSDSGFLDSKLVTPDKDNDDIVASSPQHKKRPRIRSVRNKGVSLLNSSTPNPKRLTSSLSNEESLNEKEETSERQHSHLNNSNDDVNSDSFFVPETQPFVEPKSNKNVNIFDTIMDESVKQFINEMSKEDDFYVPGTQEIFENSRKFLSNEIANINSPEFDRLNNTNNNASDLSQNLCPYLKIANKNLSFEQPIKNIDTSKSNKDLDETEEMAQLKWNETEFEIRSNATTPDMDFENITDPGKIKELRPNTIIPEFILKNVGSTSSKENTVLQQKLNIIKTKKKSPGESKKMEVFNDNMDNDFMDNDELLIPTQPFILEEIKQIPSKRENFKNFNKDFDLLEDTECFTLPSAKRVFAKAFTHKEIESDEKKNKMEENFTTKNDDYFFKDDNKNDELLKETEVFAFPFAKQISKNTSVKKLVKKDSSNTCKSNQFNESNNSKNIISLKNKINKNIGIFDSDPDNEDIISTQVFTPPKREIRNLEDLTTKSVTPVILDELDTTKIFVHPSSVNINSPSIKHMTKSYNKTDNLTTKNDIKALSKKEDNIKKPKGKKNSSIESTFKTKYTAKTNNNSETLDKTTPKASATLADADFLIDICTPVDAIKLPIRKYEYLKAIKKTKKPFKAFFEEDTENEDEEINELEIKLNKNLTENSATENRTESEDTPEFDFLQPVIPVEEIQRLDKSKFVRRNKRKFIIEESQTETESVLTEIAKFEDQIEKNKKINSVSKNTNNIKTRKQSTYKKEKSQKSSKDSRSQTSTIENELQTKKNLRNKKKKSSIEHSETNSSLSEESATTNLSRSNLSRSSNRNKVAVTFTKVNESKYIETVNNIGYKIVDNPEDASIIITNNEISRTWKLLIGLAKGLPIISVDWLKAIQEKNFSFIHYDNFYVKDRKTEKKFNFNLRESLNLAINSCQPLLGDYTFIITENTTPPKSEMERIINCAGGLIVNQVKASIKNLYVVSDKKDSNLWSTFKKNSNSLKIIKTEGILLSIMQHRNRLDDHIFK